MYFDVYDVKFDIKSAKYAYPDIHNQTLKEYLKEFDL